MIKHLIRSLLSKVVVSLSWTSRGRAVDEPKAELVTMAVSDSHGLSFAVAAWQVSYTPITVGLYCITLRLNQVASFRSSLQGYNYPRRP